MSDDLYDENGNLMSDSETDGEDDPRQWVKDLRKKAKEVDTAKAEAEAAQRELAFYKAGIPDDGPGKLFRKAYDGDVSDDAVRAAAAEYGILGDQPTSPPAASDDRASAVFGVRSQTAAEELAHQRLAQATAGASAPPPADVMEQLDAVSAKHFKTPQEEAMAVQEVMVKNGIWSGQTPE